MESTEPLVSTAEELLGRKCSDSSLESREYGRRNPSCWPRGTLCTQKLSLTSPTSGCRSVGIVRSRIQDTESFCFVLYYSYWDNFYEYIIRKETKCTNIWTVFNTCIETRLESLKPWSDRYTENYTMRNFLILLQQNAHVINQSRPWHSFHSVFNYN
jgi:hypothetical protein